MDKADVTGSEHASSLKSRQRIVLWSVALLGIAILAGALAWAVLQRKTVNEYVEQAFTLAGEGDAMAGLAELTEGISRHRTSRDLYYLYYVRANLQASLEMRKQAVEDYTEAIRLKPRF